MKCMQKDISTAEHQTTVVCVFWNTYTCRYYDRSVVYRMVNEWQKITVKSVLARWWDAESAVDVYNEQLHQVIYTQQCLYMQLAVKAADPDAVEDETVTQKSKACREQTGALVVQGQMRAAERAQRDALLKRYWEKRNHQGVPLPDEYHCESSATMNVGSMSVILQTTREAVA